VSGRGTWRLARARPPARRARTPSPLPPLGTGPATRRTAQRPNASRARCAATVTASLAAAPDSCHALCHQGACVDCDGLAGREGPCDAQCQTCSAGGTCTNVAQGNSCNDGDDATVGDTCGASRQATDFSCQPGTRTVTLTVPISSAVRHASPTLPLTGPSERCVVLGRGR